MILISRRRARIRVPPQHSRRRRLDQLQSLVLRAAGQEGRHHRRAVQRRRLGRGLHHRSSPARLRRLLQQSRRRSDAVHVTRRGHLGTEGDDRERDGGIGRRLDAVDVQASACRSIGGEADVGRAGGNLGCAGVRGWWRDAESAGRVLYARR